MRLDVEAAPAKVNLALHVVGRRVDGYHLLDTLVAFPRVCDILSVEPADGLRLRVTGPFAPALAHDDPETNLVVRAARGLAEIAGVRPDVALTLEKVLPVAAGIGGGSSDAAAAIRLLARRWAIDAGSLAVARLALSLGADVPMCLDGRPLRAGGIGDALEPVAPLPRLGILLVNPRVPVPTASVFRRLDRTDHPPLADPMAAMADGAAFLRYLAASRNDLEPAARAVAPEVGETLDALAQLDGVRLARMSGSGATCFALFDGPEEAAGAVIAMNEAHPDWWAAAAALS